MKLSGAAFWVAFGFYGGIGSLLDPPQDTTSSAIMAAI
jgi:hypothetical protein